MRGIAAILRDVTRRFQEMQALRRQLAARGGSGRSREWPDRATAMPPEADRKALLLRVGIDRGAGGALAPIFADGGFGYVPIPDDQPTRCPFIFATLPARQGNAALAAFLPRRIAGRRRRSDGRARALSRGGPSDRR
jgi:hypothetical protein